MERIVTGMLLGVALFWIGACFFVRGSGVPDLWLPVAFAIGIAIASRTKVAEERTSPRWSRAAAWIVIGSTFAIMWYGALTTASRHWDGAASFDAKVYWLEHSPTLQQPFFAADGVFHHSPDYPLLLPMLVAMVERMAPEFGRVVLPLIYMLLCGVVTTALQRRAIAPLLRVAITVAVAVTPALLTPGGGAVDSGYSECLLLLATTTVAAGLLNRHALWFATGMVLLIAAKPEGQAYATVALAVAFARFEHKLLWPGVAAATLACLIWEPVQAALLHRDSKPWLTLPLALLPFLLLWFVLRLDRRKVIPGHSCNEGHSGNERHSSNEGHSGNANARWIVVLSLPIVGLVALPWIAPLLAEGDGTIAIYMRQAQRGSAGLANLATYVAGVLEFGVSRLRLGTALLVPIAAALIAWRLQVRLRDRGVMAFAVLGLATTALPFVFSPALDIERHIRSSLPRLLLHWVGPLWLLSAGWIDSVLLADGNERCQTPSIEPSDLAHG